MGAIKFLAAVLVLQLMLAVPVQAQSPIIIQVNINSAEYLDVGFRIARMATGNPTIAGVKPVGDSVSEILIEGYQTGSTSLLIWREEYLPPIHYRIIVSPEDPGRAFLIEQAIDLPDVHVKFLDGKIMLTGTVKNQYEHNYVLQVAGMYVGGVSGMNRNTGTGSDLSVSGKSSTSTSSGNIETEEISSSGNIIDLLQILEPTQIRLEAMVIDINSDAAKDLGVRWGTSGASNPGVFTMGESTDRTLRTQYYRDSNGDLYSESYSYVTPFKNNPIRWMEQRFGAINATINALVSQGKARILSRPSITTLMGEQAKIQIGGKVPYTSINSNGSSNTDFKDYGVILQFQSTVDENEKITAAVHAEVSNLSGQTVNGQPIILTRSADTMVRLESGSTMIIGGLMDSSEAKNVSGIPLLSKIPIIGEFFKYTTKTRNKREIIILITPHIIESASTARMSPEMKDFYAEGMYEESLREDVELNPPEPVEDEDVEVYDVEIVEEE